MPLYTPATFADDDGQFALVIELLRDGGAHDRLSMSDHTAGKADENDRLPGNSAPHLLDVRPVIDPDAQYLVRPRDYGQICHVARIERRIVARFGKRC